MKRSWTIALLLVVASFFCAAPSQGTLIDDFSDGTVVNTSAPPTHFVSQPGLSGVIATGERLLEWSLSGGPATFDLDLNNVVPGSAVLSSGPDSFGFWAFYYGSTMPFDMDLTDADSSNAFVMQFGPSSAGTLYFDATDTSSNHEFHSVAIPTLPLGGLVSLPFSLFSTIDFHHAYSLSFLIETATASTYEVQAWNTQFVPEPSGFVLFGLGAFGLVFAARRRRECVE